VQLVLLVLWVPLVLLVLWVPLVLKVLLAFHAGIETVTALPMPMKT
jgi:hypothetical protein